MDKQRRKFLRDFLIILGASPLVAQLSPFDLMGRAYAYGDGFSGSLADCIEDTLNDVESWDGLTDIGVVMHESPLTDFDVWISKEADSMNWNGVLSVKRYCEQAGYSSDNVDANVKLALSNIPMFNEYSLPITDPQGRGYFWPWDRYVLYGYRYAKELGYEADRWDEDSGFLALKEVRDRYGAAFYRCNPDVAMADFLPMGTRWHEAGSLMDCFFILDQLGVKDARQYAVQEWNWLNANLWSYDYFNYAIYWQGYEYSGMDVFPNVAKLHAAGVDLENWDRVTTDLQTRYLLETWASPQWHSTYRVARHDSGILERRLDGTLTAWIMLNAFYNGFGEAGQTNLVSMLEGAGVTQAWAGLNESDLRQPDSDRFRTTSSADYTDSGTASAALCMFLMGITPREGAGLAIPLISDRHVCHGCLNFRHFEFDYENRRVKIPVWGGTTLDFGYGGEPTPAYFKDTGIYQVAFGDDWRSVSQIGKVSDLCSNELYLSPTS